MSTKVEGGGSFKTVKCSVCDKTFSRTDHLKRHQLRHSGIKPYSCIFCKDSFTRSDNLREHYPACPERGLREIPDGGRRGRRPHACDSESIMIPILAPPLTSSQCTSVKLGCDGNNPCRTCRAKRIECRYSRLQQQNIAVKRDEVPRPVIDNPQSSDIGSIKFLLNHGTASFIECFSFPPNSERRNTLESSDFSTQDSESINLNHFRNGSDNGSNFSDPFEEDSIDLSVFDDENLLRFLNGPFNNIQTQTDDVFASLFMDPTFVTFESMPDLSITPPLEWEPATVQSGAMMQAILDKAYAMQLHAKELSDISDNLSFLFLPSRIERLVKLYFETWHRHCPILHQPSFHIETAPIPLLISVTLLGAMYSQIEREAYVAKALLDISELYVYSMEDLTGESEIRHMLRAGNSDDSSMMGLSHLAFLHLQGAYLMICAQFWGGNRLARKRAMETRFGVVVKLARKLGLTKEKHDLQDSINEYSWIQKEVRIRTINIMTLIDCAFSFFANFPCRLALSEMHFDLPCDEDIFASPHPFSEADFHPTRGLGLLEAFQSLFGKTKSARHLKTDLTNAKNNPLGLNVMDMFILIHLLYVYTQVHLTLFSSSLSRSATTSSFELHIAQTKTALIRWRNLWNIVRGKISPHTWARLGFFKNAYNYWLVTQLLINNKNSLDIMMGMEVNCEDTLTHLRSLLREPGTET